MIVIILAGIMTGTFGFPMKFTTAWRWENTWTMWTVWTLLVIPWTVGLLTIPDLFGVLVASGTGALSKVFVLGMVWGVSAIAFGFGIHYLGLGLGYSLMMGMIISIGSLYPVLTGAMGTVQTSSILAVTGAVLVIVIGVVFSAWAAVIRQKDQSTSAALKPEKKSFAKGVLICLVAGITAPFINFAFVYGDAISASAIAYGAHVSAAPNAIWTVALSGGFVINIMYTLFLVRKNNNWKLFKAKGTGIYFFYTFLMGLLWAGSIIIYGMGATNLGKLGASVGWAAFNATGILWANILGLLMKEWKGVGRKGMAVMIVGLAMLLAGIFLVKLA